MRVLQGQCPRASCRPRTGGGRPTRHQTTLGVLFCCSSSTPSAVSSAAALADLTDAERDLLRVEMLGQRDGELARRADDLLPLGGGDLSVLVEVRDEALA